MRGKIPDFPSNLPFLNAENNHNSDELVDKKESLGFSFLIQEFYFFFLKEGKQNVF